MHLNISKILTLTASLILFSTMAEAATASVATQISVSSEGWLDVSYSAGKNCPEMRFRDKFYPTQLRAQWKIEDQCAVLNDTKTGFKISPSCSVVNLKIPSTITPTDRVYPVFTSIGESGGYVHTGGLAVEPTCGRQEWRVTAQDGGTVIYQGRNQGVDFKGNDLDFPKISSDAFYIGKNVYNRVVFSGSTPAWIQAALTDAYVRAQTFFGETYPPEDIKSPFVAVSTIQTSAKARPRFQASVANQGMMQFSFYDYPGQPDTKLFNNIRGTLLHEWAHLFQRDQLPPPEGAMIAEGEAEVVRMLAAQRLGWETENEFEEAFNSKLNSCIQLIGGAPLKSFRNRGIGRAPYDCGAAIQLLDLASASSKSGALQQIKIRNGEKCKDGCADQNRLQELFRTDLTIQELFSTLASKASLNLESATVEDGAVVAAAIRSYLASAMVAECKSVGFYNRQGFFEISLPNNGQCGKFSNGMKIDRLAGIDMFGSLVEALAAAKTTCTKVGTVAFSESTGPGVAEVSCDQLYVPVMKRYKLNGSALLKELDQK